MKDKEKQTKVFDILDKIEFFQGQRAGRELWLDKPKEVQDKDISDFIKDINYIRSYLQDSVVLSREEYNQLVNTKKFFETAGSQISAENLLVYLKEFKEETSKETAKKILDYFDKYAGTGKKLIGNMISEQRKKYGVGIKENL